MLFSAVVNGADGIGDAVADVEGSLMIGDVLTGRMQATDRHGDDADKCLAEKTLKNTRKYVLA